MNDDEKAKLVSYFEDLALEHQKFALKLNEHRKKYPRVNPQTNGSKPSERLVYAPLGEVQIKQAVRNSDEMEMAFKRNKNDRGYGSKEMVLERDIKELESLFNGNALKFKHNKKGAQELSAKSRGSNEKVIKSIVVRLRREGMSYRGMPKLIMKDTEFKNHIEETILKGGKEPTLRRVQQVVMEYKLKSNEK